MFYLLFVFINVYWCLSRFPYHTMFASFKSNTTDAPSGTGTDYSGVHDFTPVFCGVYVAQPLIFCVVFCTSLFVFFLCFLFVCLFGFLKIIYGLWLPIWYLQLFWWFFLLISRNDAQIKGVILIYKCNMKLSTCLHVSHWWY